MFCNALLRLSLILSVCFYQCHASSDFQIEETTYDYLGQPRRALCLSYTGEECFSHISGYDPRGRLLNVKCTPHTNLLVLLDDEQHHVAYYAGLPEGSRRKNPVFRYTTKPIIQEELTQTRALSPGFSIQEDFIPYEEDTVRALTLTYTGTLSFEGLAGFDVHNPLINIKCEPTQSVVYLLANSDYVITYYSSPDTELWIPEYAVFTYQTQAS